MTKKIRTDWATFSPELMGLFEEFAASGGPIEMSYPSKRQAYGLRARIYKARIMMQDVLATDPLAQSLFPAIQHIYLEMDPTDEGKRGPNDFWTLRIILDPLTRIRHDGRLPWKEEIET